jgi:hypothetical protein
MAPFSFSSYLSILHKIRILSGDEALRELRYYTIGRDVCNVSMLQKESQVKRAIKSWYPPCTLIGLFIIEVTLQRLNQLNVLVQLH